MLVWGDSEFLLRLPSAVFGILTIPIIYLVTRRLADTTAAVVASFVLAISFYNIGYSQEARAYALVNFSIAFSFLGLMKLWATWNPRSSGLLEFMGSGGASFSVGLIAALYSHNTSVFYWLAVQFFFVHWWFSGGKSFVHLRYWFVVNVTILALWLPWAMASLAYLQKEVFRVMPYPAELAFLSFRWVHGVSIAFKGSLAADVGPSLLVLAGLFGLWRRQSLLLLFVSLILCSSLLIWLTGFALTPIFMPRTILWGSIFSAILMGMGASFLPKPVGYGLAIATILAGILNALHYFKEDIMRNEDWRSVVQTFSRMQEPGDILLFRSNYVSIPFVYYLGHDSPDWEYIGWDCQAEKRMTGVMRGRGSRRHIKWDEYINDPVGPIPTRPTTHLWVVESHCASGNWDLADSLMLPAWELDQMFRHEGVNLYRWKPVLLPPVSRTNPFE